MAKKRFSGLDELMIVNPGLPSDERALPLGQIFFGEDGRLYRLEGLQAEETLGEFAEFYLGEDGTLYRLQGPASTDQSYFGEMNELQDAARVYFLGEDGTLYQTI